MTTKPIQSFLAAFSLMITAASALADNWPEFRGPGGKGRSVEKDLPVKWSKTEGVRWKLPLPEPGNSTPIIWGDRVFLTQSTNKGKERSLWCIDRDRGTVVWKKTVEYSGKEPTHGTNYFCSASPVTDGKTVVVSHGSAGLFAYDFKGNELWRRDFGPCFHIWGNAASPVIYQNLVLFNFGPGENTFVTALRPSDGKDVWKRDEPGGKQGEKGEPWIGSWSTPVIVKTKSGDELIMTWPGVVRAYRPLTGEPIWSCEGLARDKGTDRLVYTSPIVGADTIVAMAGYGGPAIGVKLGGTGNVTKTHRLWRTPTAPQRIGSGVVIGDHVYMVNEPGTAQWIDIKTGKIEWTERLPGKTWGSVTLAGDHIYVILQGSDTMVLKAGPKFEVVAQNTLGEGANSSVAVSDGALFIRTFRHLWCIDGKK